MTTDFTRADMRTGYLEATSAMKLKLKLTLLIAGGAYVIFIHAFLIILVLKTDFLFLAGKTLGWIRQRSGPCRSCSEFWNRQNRMSTFPREP